MNRTEVVYIVGVAPRCGTNYLEGLLALHPDCGVLVPMRQNNLLSKLPTLAKLVKDVERQWQQYPHWGFLEEHTVDLYRAFGAALNDFLTSQVQADRRLDQLPEQLKGIRNLFKESPKYLLSKQPRTTGLDVFRHFFPIHKLILLMRDGRAVTESSIRSWNWSLGVATESWARGAKDISRFIAQDKGPHLLVRYEDVVAAPGEVLPEILRFIGLDADQYDLAAAMSSPVRGSSTQRPTRGAEVSWTPIQPTDEFSPLARAASWDARQHSRFNHLVGTALLTEFGYAPVDTPSSIRSVVDNLLGDGTMAARKLRQALRRRMHG